MTCDHLGSHAQLLLLSTSEKSARITKRLECAEHMVQTHLMGQEMIMIALVSTKSMAFLARSLTSLLSISAMTLAVAGSAIGQTINESQMRAANLARMQAELINGGLGQYSPADCMHQGGGGSCLESSTSAGYRFRFLGGAAGWSARQEKATIETIVFVSPDGRVSKVEYNGPVRTGLNR
jgi:hypothetical protein